MNQNDQIQIAKIHGNRLQIEVLNPFDVSETLRERNTRKADPSALVLPEHITQAKIEVPDSAIQALQYRVARVLVVGDGEKAKGFHKGDTIILSKMGAIALLDTTLIVSAEDVLASI